VTRDDPLYYDRHGRQWRTAITEPHAVQQRSIDINSYNVDIAAVTETHLKNKHAASVVAIPGYTLL